MLSLHLVETSPTKRLILPPNFLKSVCEGRVYFVDTHVSVSVYGYLYLYLSVCVYVLVNVFTLHIYMYVCFCPHPFEAKQ